MSAPSIDLPPEARALTIREAAKALQVSERTIKLMRADGRLPNNRALGVARIPLSAIILLLAGDGRPTKRLARRPKMPAKLSLVHDADQEHPRDGKPPRSGY